MQTDKAKATELAGKIREAAAQGEPVARAIQTIIRLQLDAVKEQLVIASGEDILRMQGEARRLQRIYKELTETPPQIKPGAPE